jgi:hypothetical protein
MVPSSLLDMHLEIKRGERRRRQEINEKQKISISK